MARLGSLLILLLAPLASGFTPLSVPTRSSALQAASTDTDSASTTTTKGLLQRDRYIATNRFAVRSGQAAKFEKRWATRKSKLATLDGFRYFHLMRRVTMVDGTTTVYDEGSNDQQAQENYVSFTIWQRKSDFSAWRTGEAFKEAHGGTSIGAFLSTMVNSALVLRGPPRPAFYDGLLVQSTKPESVPDTVDGWRNVEADGVTTLPTECFVQMVKYFVPLEQAAAFEQSMVPPPPSEGLIAYSLMRRDGQAKGHGVAEVTSDEPTYVTTYIFANQDAWSQFATIEPVSTDYSTRPPETVLYEGTLVIASPEGA